MGMDAYWNSTPILFLLVCLRTNLQKGPISLVPWPGVALFLRSSVSLVRALPMFTSEAGGPLIFSVQLYSADQDNPRIVLCKPWIRALHDNPQIGRTIPGLHLTRGAKYGWMTNSWIARVVQCLDCTQSTVQSMDNKEKPSCIANYYQ